MAKQAVWEIKSKEQHMCVPLLLLVFLIDLLALRLRSNIKYVNALPQFPPLPIYKAPKQFLAQSMRLL
ncbi:hypothetical protein XELAEV_18010982mg [Xenopus laevis]|uniref:Uncharacterized protein n=1 Tax=Xenopus laevis TaxID=8355 RepID=A0A974I2B7_XENLA|nr:hypothetical protein XELAEV_18010982mg [Xenopus laevis]